MQPGDVYTTFHDPETGANAVTTEYSDWVTNCPEYKVTAVQVAPAVHRSKWQHQFEERARAQGKILETSQAAVPAGASTIAEAALALPV